MKKKTPKFPPEIQESPDIISKDWIRQIFFSTLNANTGTYNANVNSCPNYQLNYTQTTMSTSRQLAHSDKGKTTGTKRHRLHMLAIDNTRHRETILPLHFTEISPQKSPENEPRKRRIKQKMWLKTNNFLSIGIRSIIIIVKSILHFFENHYTSAAFRKS
jgi:hypothetical protein